MNERNETKTMNDKLNQSLKQTQIKIQTLRKQIQLYKVAHSELQKIFLSGLEVFNLVDFGSYASVEKHKFSLEVLQKHFLKYAEKARSLEVPTERELEGYILRKRSKFAGDREERRRRSNNLVNISSSSDSEGELAAILNLGNVDSGTDDEQLRDSGLESVKEEVGTNEIDLSDINFGDENPESDSAHDKENKKERWKSSEDVVNRTINLIQTVKQSNSILNLNGNNRTTAIEPIRVKSNMTVLTESPTETTNANVSMENSPLPRESLRGGWENVTNEVNVAVRRENNFSMTGPRVNDPMRGMLCDTPMWEATSRPEAPTPKVHSGFRRQFDSSTSKGRFFNSSQEGQHHVGNETVEMIHTSQPRSSTPETVEEVNAVTSTMMERVNRSPVFKDCNPRRHSGRHEEDFTRNSSTPFRQLNENFAVTSGRSVASVRGHGKISAKNKTFSRKKSINLMCRKQRQEEEGRPSGVTRLRQTFLTVERFKRRSLEEEKKSSEDRENEGNHPNNQQPDNTSEDEDDIIYGSPGEIDESSPFNSKKEEAGRNPNFQPITETLDTPDLDETFISPTVVKNYQMSRVAGPPVQFNRPIREASPEYDSVPFVYQRSPVRKRAERMKLPGQACAECNKYYNNFYAGANTNDYKRMLNKCSRHRNAGGQDETPPGFWTPFLTGNDDV